MPSDDSGPFSPPLDLILHPTPQPEDLAAAGFSYTGTKEYPDRVQCTMCRIILDKWEPEDNAFREQIRRSLKCTQGLSCTLTASAAPAACTPTASAPAAYTSAAPAVC